MRVLIHFILWTIGLTKAETQTTEAERDALARYAMGRKTVVEIGVWHGVTTSRLRAAMASGGVLYAIDPFPVGRLGFSIQNCIAHHEVSRIKNGAVRWIRLSGEGAARKMAQELHGRVDFVFIDGDHSYEGLKADWNGWSGLMAVGGVVALHDSRTTATRQISGAGSVQFTNDVVLRDERFELADLVDSLTILRRRS